MNAHVERARQIAEAIDAPDRETTLYQQFYAEWKAWEAEDPTHSMRAFDREIGRGHDYTARIARFVNGAPERQSPFNGERQQADRERHNTRKVLREPVERRKVIASLSDDEVEALAREPRVRAAAEDAEVAEARERAERNRENAIKAAGPKPLSAFFWTLIEKVKGYTRDIKWIGDELDSLEPEQIPRVMEIHVALRDRVNANIARLEEMTTGETDVIEGHEVAQGRLNA